MFNIQHFNRRRSLITSPSTRHAGSLASLNDRVLVQRIKTSSDAMQARELKLALYARYERLVHKHWHALARRMNTSSSVVGLKEDFYSESYLTFDKALKAIKLEKIQDDNWKFLGYFGYYLSATKNSYAKGIVKRFRNETAIEVPAPSAEGRTIYLSDLAKDGVVRSAEDEVLLRDEQARVQKALEKCRTSVWSLEQNCIFDLRATGKSVKAVCQEVGMSSWKYNKLLGEMKVSLERETELAYA